MAARCWLFLLLLCGLLPGYLQATQLEIVLADSALSAQSTWRGEMFYRRFGDLISYTLDDLRLSYSGRNDATGYAWGMNTHLQGQVSRLVGIFSYGYLVANTTCRISGWAPSLAPCRD